MRNVVRANLHEQKIGGHKILTFKQINFFRSMNDLDGTRHLVTRLMGDPSVSTGFAWRRQSQQNSHVPEFRET